MKIKLFACFVVSLPFSFIYILVYLVIAFSLQLESVKIVFNILFFFLLVYNLHSTNLYNNSYFCGI